MDIETSDVMAYGFDMREHKHLDKLLELLEPFAMSKGYTDGNDAYYERFDSDVLVVSKQNTQKIERKHLSLWTLCSRLVRKGIRFSKSLMMLKIASDLPLMYTSSEISDYRNKSEAVPKTRRTVCSISLARVRLFSCLYR